MEAIPIIKVKHPSLDGEFMIINKADFNPQVHEVYEEKSEKRRSKKEKSEEPATELPATEPSVTEELS